MIKILSFNISHYNYSMCVNNVPLIKSLLFEVSPQENASDFYGKDLYVTIKATPEIFHSYHRSITISADGKCDISGIEPEMRPRIIQAVTEPQKCTIDITVRDRHDVCGSLSYNVDLQPYYCWSGFSCMPEYLCSLVTPSQPQVQKIVSSAYELLRNQGELPINDGYEKKNIKKVFAINRAIYDSIRSLKITYNITKTDYLSKCVSLQTAEMLMHRMIGSSLDISLVFAACLENLGLNPFITVFRNHVLIGCFLSDLNFTNPVTENFDELMAMGRGPRRVLFLMEPTSMANGMSIDFENSCRMAKEYCEKNAAHFTAIVDIKAARIAGIKPIPNRIVENGKLVFDGGAYENDDFFSDWVDINDENIDAAEREINKLKSEIFDFSENNPLINADFKNVVGLAYTSSVEAFASKLKNPTTLTPSPFSENTESVFLPDQRCAVMERCINELNEKPGETATFCTEAKLKKRIHSIYNITSCDRYYRYYTYVTFYYAKWKSPDSANTIYTPMFLVPCELSGSPDGCKLRLLTDNAILNPIFLEKIKRLFTVNFVTLSKIPAREILTRREYIFSLISSAVSGRLDIKFIPYVSLSAHDLSSFSDYTHLNKNSVSSPLSRALLMGTETPPESRTYGDIDVDSIFPLNMPCPLEPDRFQKSAVYHATEDKSTFISGNINSGKTRTAANIIFNTLYKSKTVLYVGGTPGACSDLEKYLGKLSLNDYTLYLRPYAPDLTGAFNTEKLPEKRPSELYIKAQRMMQKKSELSNYYKALHKKQKTGFDLYQNVMQYEKYKNSKYCVAFSPAFIKELDEDKVIASLRQISELTKAVKLSGQPYRHPLAKIGRKTFSYEIKAQAVTLINSYKAALESFLDCQDELCELMCFDFEFLREDQSNSLEKLAYILQNCSDVLTSSIFDTKCKNTLNRLHGVIDLAEKRLSSSEKIFGIFEEHVLDIDAAQMLEEYKASLSTFFIKRNGIQKKLLTMLKNHLIDDKVISVDELPDTLYSLVHYAENTAKIAAEASDFKELFGIDMFTRNIEMEREALEKLKKIYSVCEEYVLHLDNICRRECNPEDVIPSQASVITDFVQNPDIYKTKFAEYKKLRATFTEAENTLVKYLSVDIYSLKDKMAIKWYEYVYAWITELEQSIDGLKSWCEYLNARDNALAIGLDSAVALLENTDMTQDEFRQAFLKGFFKASCEYILANEQVFASFSSESCADACNGLSELILQLDEMIIEDLGIKLRTDYRDYHNRYISDNEEKTYLDSKDMGELFASNLKLLQKRFPVTVSYGSAINAYLAEDTMFDCLIIDDVHAIPYYSLLGLISRAEKTVFLGMDTTKENTLFSAPAAYSLIGRGAAYSPASLYSRLIKADVPLCKLEYKYDTRRDLASLVSEIFSFHNEHVIPWATEMADISIIPVNGVFERRGTLVNYAEANCVVETLKNLVTDESIAVCAFTRPQAALIRQLWDQSGSILDNLKIYAIEDYPSACFDRVIVSTTFSSGNNTGILPFNPAQLAGDNYRLRFNSLMSSLRNSLTVITALNENSLDELEPYTDSLYAFKRFIKFIYDRYTYFAPAKPGEFDKCSIRGEICDFLQKLGYDTVQNLGTSELKIDVAVRSKENNGYILGVLLDNYCGQTNDVYTSEVLMPTLLKKNGWNVIRIFTNEWYENYNKQLEAISEKLATLK